jgi:hypothetical protein
MLLSSGDKVQGEFIPKSLLPLGFTLVASDMLFNLNLFLQIVSSWT